MPALVDFYINAAQHGPEKDRQGNLSLVLEELVKAVKEIERKLDQQETSP